MEQEIETGEAGFAQGQHNAAIIKHAFDEGVITISEPQSSTRIADVNATGSLVLWLAADIRARSVLINDRDLIQKAEKRGLPVMLTAEFVKRLYEGGLGSYASSYLRIRMTP